MPESSWRILAPTVILLSVCALPRFTPLAAQEDRRTKVPVVGKIVGGSNRQAFTGKVQSVDLKRNLLLVDTVEGSSTEYFPLKKNVNISRATGRRLTVKELARGTNVIVYYQVHDDRRTVTDIVVLGTANSSEAKKANPPS